jgi:hypothetical protein
MLYLNANSETINISNLPIVVVNNKKGYTENVYYKYQDSFNNFMNLFYIDTQDFFKNLFYTCVRLKIYDTSYWKKNDTHIEINNKLGLFFNDFYFDIFFELFNEVILQNEIIYYIPLCFNSLEIAEKTKKALLFAKSQKDFMDAKQFAIENCRFHSILSYNKDFISHYVTSFNKEKHEIYEAIKNVKVNGVTYMKYLDNYLLIIIMHKDKLKEYSRENIYQLYKTYGINFIIESLVYKSTNSDLKENIKKIVIYFLTYLYASK